MNGKGDKRRPQKVSNKIFDENWTRIFSKNVDEKPLKLRKSLKLKKK